MRILICISQLTKGGAERVVCNLANYLIKKHLVEIAVLRNLDIEYKINNNIKVIQLENRKDIKKNKIYKTIKRYNNLKKLFKKNDYDVILSFLPEPSFMLLKLKKKRNLRVVVSVRNDPKIEYKSFIKKVLMKWLYPKADGFVFQTTEAKEYFCEKIQDKSKIIMNSIDPEFIVSEPFIGERDKTIVSVGRLSEQKNHRMLIESFSKIHKKFPEYKLIIYGEGELRDQLEKQVKELRIENVVEMPGIVNDIKDKIYKSSIFVLSSNFEGMPNALIEAMTLGIPCISTDCSCGGPRELIKNGENGILTEVGNTNMLKEKLEELLKNKEKQKHISLNANMIKNKLNIESINQEWEDALKYFIKKDREG